MWQKHKKYMIAGGALLFLILLAFILQMTGMLLFGGSAKTPVDAIHLKAKRVALSAPSLTNYEAADLQVKTVVDEKQFEDFALVAYVSESDKFCVAMLERLGKSRWAFFNASVDDMESPANFVHTHRHYQWFSYSYLRGMDRTSAFIYMLPENSVPYLNQKCPEHKDEYAFTIGEKTYRVDCWWTEQLGKREPYPQLSFRMAS